MSANAQSNSQSEAPPKRLLRNFLLDPRFQLKYTGMVVLVTVVVASALGYVAYDHSRSLTAATTASDLSMDLAPEALDLLIAESEAKDQEVLLSIIAGIGILAFVLGATGIMVTHKVVGPSFKLRRLIGDVATGKLVLTARLRKGDELQDVFLAFERMVDGLRAGQQEEIAILDKAIAAAREGGAGDDALAQLSALRDRMQGALE